MTTTGEKAKSSLAETARTVIGSGRIGMLSTHSCKFPGFPFGSLMPYALDASGCPILFISSMALHTQNLRADSRVSLLTAENDVASPLNAARVTIMGLAERVESAEVEELYLSVHENARQWRDFSDFAFYRIAPSRLYCIAGFGAMGWIEPAEYAIAWARS